MIKSKCKTIIYYYSYEKIQRFKRESGQYGK